METKLNSGVLFKNAKKTSDKAPDYKGKVNVNGKEMEISMWVKESQKGVKYFSVSFQEPYVKQNTNTGNFMPNDFRVNSHDDLF